MINLFNLILRGFRRFIGDLNEVVYGVLVELFNRH